jgi:ATP-dependent helicase/nuclease subunit B
VRALLDLIDDNTTLVSVNRRLSRAVIEAYAQLRIAAGETAWRTPDVIPFSAWVERSFRAGQDNDGVLLRAAQERLLWEQVIGEGTPPAGDDEAPLEVAPAARRAAEAYAIVNAWNIPLDARDFDFSKESRAFRTWARAFRVHCEECGWIDSASAATALAESDRIAAANPRPRAVFAGFDFVTPQQQAIRTALARRGVAVMDASRPQRKARCVVRAVDDPTSELRAAALWARSRVNDAPESRLGIVIPELHRMRAAVERIFGEAFSPGCAMPGMLAVDRGFNITYGEPLSRISVIGDALIALRLAGGAVELAEAGRLLRSPYLRAGLKAISARARFDAGLRDIGEPELTLDGLAARAARDPALELGLRGLLDMRREVPRRQLMQFWADFFSRWLWTLGWPGERSPDSAEFQALEAFGGLLDELAGMGAVTGPVALEEALRLFLKRADETVFQPRSEPAPVQILGALESAGLSFDGLWVAGLHDGCWPPAPEPDPFVPVSLQRAAGLPSASSDAQLRLARDRLRAWCGAAGEVVLSYPRYQQDEPLRPSPLIGAASLEAVEDDAESPPVEFSLTLNLKPAGLERVDDQRAPPLGSSRGGAGVLGDQAACPFRAFARWRLGADAVPVAASPLDARIRGNLVHAVLNALWTELRSQSNLKAVPAETLRERISLAVEQAIAGERRRRPDTLRGPLARVERARLCALMEAWLEAEKARAPFEVVALERTIDTAVGPLSLKVRPDRVDRLESGEHFVIDYKTGNAEVRHWFGERPEDPQLALYTLAVESDGADVTVAGAAYGGLKRGAIGYRGLADLDGLAAGVAKVETSTVKAAKTVTDWAALKFEWRRTLESLAVAYASGEAKVDPKSPPATCANCRVMPLCRVFEHGAPAKGEAKP